MTTPKTVDALQEKWTARLGTRVAVHKEERVHQGNSFRYGLYVHSVNTAADMVWPDVWHPAWERGGGAALASLDAALEAAYPEPEPFEPTFTYSGYAPHQMLLVHDAAGTQTLITAAEVLEWKRTHEAVKAWEARAKGLGCRCFVQGNYDNVIAFISDLDSGATMETMVLTRVTISEVDGKIETRATVDVDIYTKSY